MFIFRTARRGQSLCFGLLCAAVFATSLVSGADDTATTSSNDTEASSTNATSPAPDAVPVRHGNTVTVRHSLPTPPLASANASRGASGYIAYVDADGNLIAPPPGALRYPAPRRAPAFAPVPFRSSVDPNAIGVDVSQNVMYSYATVGEDGAIQLRCEQKSLDDNHANCDHPSVLLETTESQNNATAEKE